MAEMKKRKGLLERLREGPVLGDGGMTIGLERRGYAKVGVFTPESTVLHPDAGTVRGHECATHKPSNFRSSVHCT